MPEATFFDNRATSSSLDRSRPRKLAPTRRVAAVAVGLLVAFAAPARGKTIDLSNKTDPAGVFNVAFCGRPSPDPSGKPGHAFVSYSHKKVDGDRDFLAIGHTVPPGAAIGGVVWSYFGGAVSGLLKEELYTSVKQNCLDVQVNQDDYRRARALAADPLVKMGLTTTEGTVFQAYRLGSQDCMSFLIEVAQTLKSRGLKVPDRGATDVPMAYVQRLIDTN
ncbi:hypothetical protein ABS772_23485 [Methylorubrum podarium]|uniref:Uncharacterized protein n=1 Tax=Methylorubrum podarium TaxID=200476 RepID=A0ABV1QTY5_9HYPH